MASSDNVLRGGLTPKHVNVPELLRVLDFRPLAPPLVAPGPTAGEWVYATPAAEFRLSRIELDGGDWTAAVDGPEILLCTAGELIVRPAGADASGVALPRGGSLFVPATTKQYTLAGRGTAFRAAVP
jgi:mannose-6-phosphate isomerase